MAMGDRLFRALLLLYPPGFRKRYAGDLLAFFRLDRERARQGAAPRSPLHFWGRTIADLLRASASQWGDVLARLLQRAPFARRHPYPTVARKAHVMETLLQDLRYAVRTFRRTPGFTVVAIATLALGIGINAAMFSVVDGILLKRLPYGDVNRVVSIWGTATDGDFGVSENERLRYREQRTIFDAFGTFFFTSATVSAPDGAERLQAASMDDGALPALGVSPILGRGFVETETVIGSDPVILLSHALWRTRFEGSPDVLGEVMVVNGRERTVIGVLPADFRLPGNYAGAPVQLYFADVFGDPDPRNLHYMQGVARLASGVTLSQARAHMASVGTRLTEELPSLPETFVPATVPVTEVVTGEIRPILLILLGAVGLLLLIACVNVANLFLARSDSRSTEMAVRTAIGANRGRLVRQLLSESVVLSLIGGGLGLALAHLTTTVIQRFDPPNIPRIDQLGVDLRVVLFTLGVSLLTAFAFGLIPALASSGARMHANLREGGRSGTSSATRNRVRRAFVVAEVGLALTLMTGAGLLLRSFANLISTDAGLDPEGVLTLRTTLPSSRYGDADAARAFYADLLGQIRAMPGVVSAGAISTLPLASDPGDWGIRIEGREDEFIGGGRRPWADRMIATEGYFETMGIEVTEGRTLRPQDMVGNREVVVVNETAARRYWPNESALGKRFMLSTNIDSVYREIVGITRDVKHGGLAQETKPEMYLPHAQHPATLSFPVGSMSVVIRTSGDPLSLVNAVRRTVNGIDSEVPVSDVEAMTDVVAASTSTEQLNVSLFAVFGSLALILVSVGVYGVMSYQIAQRSKELGIRMALGARPSSVLRMIFRHGMTMAIGGAAIGIVGALALGRVLSGLLYGITWYDPVTLIAAPTVVTLVALLACSPPARRATRVDPIHVLRNE